MTIDVENPPPTSETTVAPSPDVVHLNEALNKFEQLKKLIGEMPSIDAVRIAGIKKAIEDGTYKVNSVELANKLFEIEASLKTPT